MMPAISRENVERIRAALLFLFPEGNYACYAGYLTFALVVGFNLIMIPVFFGMLDGGVWIQTDTFVAVMSNGIHISDGVAGFISYMLGCVWWLLVVLMIHTAASACIDAGRVGASIAEAIRDRLFPMKEETSRGN